MITEIKHIIIKFQLNIEKLEFENSSKRDSFDRNSNTFYLSANGFLFFIGGKIITNQLIITN